MEPTQNKLPQKLFLLAAIIILALAGIYVLAIFQQTRPTETAVTSRNVVPFISATLDKIEVQKMVVENGLLTLFSPSRKTGVFFSAALIFIAQHLLCLLHTRTRIQLRRRLHPRHRIDLPPGLRVGATRLLSCSSSRNAPPTRQLPTRH